MMDTPEEIENTKEGSKKLGELLVSYRNKVGMDIDQAADAMCLTRGTLEALENEDFHLLPEAPYIRGYLRGYAKLADVSSAEAIALYESINGGGSSINPTYHFTPSAKTDNLSPNGLSSTVLRFGGLLLLLIVLAVISTIPGVKDWAGEIWSEFSSETPTEQVASDEAAVVAEESNDETDDKNRAQLALPKNTETLTLASSTSNESDDDKEQADESSSNDEAPSADSLAGDIKREDEGEAEESQTSDSEDADDTNETEENASNGDSEANDTAEQTDSENTTDESNADAETESSSDASDASSENEGVESSEESTDESADGNEVAQAEGEEAEQTDAENETTDVDLSNVNVEAGEVAIKLVFEDEVWMRIKKKDGKQIFEGLRQKGEVHEMKTVKPLDFKVGNAPGVKIYVNGELYDQSAHQRGVVSRFDLE